MSKKMEVNDERYTCMLEFTGKNEKQHVVRFCGDFVGAHDGRGEAEISALKHAIERGQNRSGWDLLARVGEVLWLRKGKYYRVAYGAHITDFKDSLPASQDFGACLHHYLECEGYLL